MTSFRQVFKGLELIHRRTADNAVLFSQYHPSGQTVFGVVYDDRTLGPVDKMALEGWGWDLRKGRMQITF